MAKLETEQCFDSMRRYINITSKMLDKTGSEENVDLIMKGYKPSLTETWTKDGEEDIVFKFD